MTALLDTGQHHKPVSIAEYAVGLARHGIPVVPDTEGTIWVRHDAGAMMRVPRFHLVPPVPREARRIPWRGRVAASSYIQEPDEHHPANACVYICADRTYGLDKLPSAMRRNVRRGTKELKVAWLTPDELLTYGATAFVDTRRRVGVSDGTTEEFAKRFGWRSQCPGHVFLGAWRDEQLAAFLSLIEVEDWVEIESCYSMDALLPWRPNDTLMYSVLFHYLREREYRLVCYGVSSIQAENNAVGLYAFKRKVGFDAPLVHRAFVLHPLLRPFANRVTLWGMNTALRVWPHGRLLKKAEGMLAYMWGADRTPPQRQQEQALPAREGLLVPKKVVS
jgi:hypothetical protein